MTYETLKKAKELEKDIDYLAHLYDSITEDASSFLIINNIMSISLDTRDNWYKTLDYFLACTQERLGSHVLARLDSVKVQLKNL